MNNSFFTIDFEAATSARNSACQVAVVVTIDGVLEEKFSTYIKPPNNAYNNFAMAIHGITPKITANAPDWTEVYNHNLIPLFERYKDINLMVAHNTAYDRSVFNKTSEFYDIKPKEFNWFCTHQSFRKLGYEKTKLNILCDKFGIPLKHHDAESDTIATSKIYLEYLKLVTI